MTADNVRKPAMRAAAPVIAAALILLTAGGAHAQTHALDAGSYRVGGTGTFSRVSASSSVSGGGGSETRMAVAPLIQYFVVPGLALGGTLTLDHRRSGGSSVTSLGVGPSGTYYFHAPGRAAHPYVTAGANLGRSWLDAPGDNRNTMSGGRAAGGLIWLVAPNVGLTGELFYDRVRHVSRSGPIENRVTSEAVGLAGGFSIFLF